MAKILIHTSKRGPRIEEPLTYAGYSVVGIPGRMMKKNKILKLVNLTKTVAREDPDLIFVDSAGLMLVTSYVLSRLFRIPLLLRVRADIWSIYDEQREYLGLLKRLYEYILLRICERLYRRSERLFCVSEYLKRVLEEKKIEKERIRVLRFSVDTERFHPVEKDFKRVTFLSVTNFSYKRKMEGLIEILPVVDEIMSQYKDTQYLIAGKGKFLPFLKEKIETMVNKDRIFYVGYQKAVETLYARADILIHYSFLDTSPAVVLEAMACSTPVIANRYDGMIEQVQDGGSGFLADDASSFRDRLETLTKEKKMREEMGKRGRAFVLKNHNISYISACFKREIDEVLL
ncbi:MAG: glycosyltransferase family 4 protein [Theionarchaea archaeon]|nr:glycosyltransferase family 4 protein [Theionarchaea archaeon]MBU7038887.1 glycosyltransferase family 4 protein [Theionarchaea archaeon]